MDKAETRLDELERLVSQQRADIDNLHARIADLEQRVIVHDAALSAFGDTASLLADGGNGMAAKIEELETVAGALVNDVAMLDTRTREHADGINLHTVAIEKLIGGSQ